MNNKFVLQKLLPKFKDKFLADHITAFGRQWMEIVEGSPHGRPQWEDYRNFKTVSYLTDRFLYDHFSGKAHYADKVILNKATGETRRVKAIYGSYGLCLLLPHNIVKTIGIDADTPELVSLLYDTFIPQLKNWEIDYIFEYSGVNQDRAHLWIMCDSIAHIYITSFLEQIQFNSCKTKEEWFTEQYPFNGRAKSLFRMPYGLYIKGMCVNWANLNGEEEAEDLEAGLELFIKARPLTQEKILSVLTKRPKYVKKQYKKEEELVVLPAFIDLPMPEGTPEYIKKIGSKCQAIHKLINRIQEPDASEDHDVGLALAGMSTHNDNLYETVAGKEWMENLPVGVNSPEQNLLYYYPNRSYTPNCKSWDSLINECDGCIYKDYVSNPRQLFAAQELDRTKIGDIRLASFEEIRDEVFPQVDKVIDELIKDKQEGTILLESIPGSGKSVYADQLARRLAQQGLTIAIACNTAEVAMEHKKRIEWHDYWLSNPLNPTGDRAFVLFSFEKLFEHLPGKVPVCPNFEDIKTYKNMGIDSSVFKKKYCKKCPFLQDCNFPDQYSEVQDPKHNIVIIQHAHLSCGEVVRQLMRKDFDVLIIDENFVDSCFTNLIMTKKEKEFLAELPNPPAWLPFLLKWVNEGGQPGILIRPSRRDLKPIMDEMRLKDIPYRLDQFIRQYNDGEHYHPANGVMKFNPVPDIPIKLLTDATPTEEELQIILNTKNIIKLGGGIVLDPSIYNPRSKTYQVLDGKASKNQMLGKEKLFEYLEAFGDKFMAEYEDLTGLFTVHMSYKDSSGHRDIELETQDWLIRNYPSIIPRVAVNHMAVGTNSFAKFNVQVIGAAPYIGPRDLAIEVYKLKFAYNYWARIEDRPTINNPYPLDEYNYSTGDAPYYEPVKVIHRDGIYLYNQYKNRVPHPDSWEYLVYYRLKAKLQQGSRIRHSDDKVTINWFLDNSSLESQLVDEVVTENQLLGPIRSQYITIEYED